MKKKRQSQPVSVLDVASYILANHTRNQPLPAWKMHKIAFYCQAFSLVREGIPFFNEKIFSTQRGVVINELLPQHFNQLYVGGSTIGNLNHLSLKQVDTIDEVMKLFGNKTAEELDALILSESPENGVTRGSKESAEVDLDAMKKFYSNNIHLN
jgi:uncharacterized phage-associated protein